MKMAKYYLISMCLVLAALTLMVKAVKNKKEAAMLASQLTLKQVSQDQAKPVPVSDATAITVKQTIEGLALTHKISMPIWYEKEARIKIGGNGPQLQQDKDKSPAAGPVQEGSDKKENPKRPSVLANYDGVIGFLNSLAGLPYLIEYETGCLGDKCEGGLDLTIIVKKLPVNS